MLCSIFYADPITMLILLRCSVLSMSLCRLKDNRGVVWRSSRVAIPCTKVAALRAAVPGSTPDHVTFATRLSYISCLQNCPIKATRAMKIFKKQLLVQKLTFLSTHVRHGPLYKNILTCIFMYYCPCFLQFLHLTVSCACELVQSAYLFCYS